MRLLEPGRGDPHELPARLELGDGARPDVEHRLGEPAHELVHDVRERTAVGHLPLDAHEEIGNNVIMARQLGLKPRRQFLPHENELIGWIAPNKYKRSQLTARLEELYPRVVSIECGPAVPKNVAFCTGSGNGAVPHLAAAGVDTLITGELREEWFNYAQEHKLNLICCGHYATEVHGVKALAAELAKKFRLPWEFIETENPL